MKKSSRAARHQQVQIAQYNTQQKKESNTPGFTQNGIPPTNSTEPPLFFFKEDQENGWLCQWYRCYFRDPANDDLMFNCAEQWMMYHKAKEFGDIDAAGDIMKATSPRKQKGLARNVANFNESRWNDVRSRIVEEGNYLKFTQCTNVASFRMDDKGEPIPLKDLLLATGDRELVEASPFDRVWGIGFKAEEAPYVPRVQWGENLLGKALMKVRERLKREMKDE